MRRHRSTSPLSRGRRWPRPLSALSRVVSMFAQSAASRCVSRRTGRLRALVSPASRSGPRSESLLNSDRIMNRATSSVGSPIRMAGSIIAAASPTGSSKRCSGFRSPYTRPRRTPDGRGPHSTDSTRASSACLDRVPVVSWSMYCTRRSSENFRANVASIDRRRFRLVAATSRGSNGCELQMIETACHMAQIACANPRSRPVAPRPGTCSMTRTSFDSKRTSGTRTRSKGASRRSTRKEPPSGLLGSESAYAPASEESCCVLSPPSTKPRSRAREVPARAHFAITR